MMARSGVRQSEMRQSSTSVFKSDCSSDGLLSRGQLPIEAGGEKDRSGIDVVSHHRDSCRCADCLAHGIVMNCTGFIVQCTNYFAVHFAEPGSGALILLYRFWRMCMVARRS